jgi:hypothetical protein
MSAKKTAVKKAAKSAVALQPVKVEQATIAAAVPAVKPSKPGTARLLNKTTGQVVVLARKVAESLSEKYPQQYQTLN